MTITKSGELASFYTVNKAPIKHLRVYFSPKQAGEGDPSPENVREISGWTGVTVKQDPGIIYMPNQHEEDSHNFLTRFETIPNGLRIINGDNNRYCCVRWKWDCPEYAGKTVRFRSKGDSSIGMGAKRVFITAYDASNQNLGILQQTSQAILNTLMTIPEGTQYLLISLYSSDTVAYGTGKYTDYTDVYIATEENTLQTLALDWTEVETVYGGYVDLVTGEVWKNCLSIVFDGSSDELWAANGTDGYYYNKAIIDEASPGVLMCSHYNAVSNRTTRTMSEGDCAMNALGRAFQIFDTSVSTSAEFKSKLNADPVTVLIELVTPQLVTTLTPAELKTFIGHNNIWSNADRVEIEYDLAESNDELYRRRNILLRTPHIETAAGNIASFKTDMKAPLKECKIEFKPIQDTSNGTPSPDNICPISGWTGIEVYRTGKNIFPNENGTTGILNLKAGTVITASTATSSGGYFRGTDKDNKNVTPIVWLNQFDENGRNKTSPYTLPTDIAKGFIFLSGGVTEAQITLDDSSSYELYQGITIPADWPSIGTVYGGYVDLVTGEVWKMYHHMIIDKNSRVGIFPWMGIMTDDATGLEYTGVLWMREKNDPAAKGYNNLICYCDSYPYHTLGSRTRIMNSAGMYDGDTYGPSLFLSTSEVGTTSESLAAFMEDKIFNFVYLMREPQLVGTLTPTQLTTLRSTNNIWSNSNGNIEVKYWTH